MGSNSKFRIEIGATEAASEAAEAAKLATKHKPKIHVICILYLFVAIMVSDSKEVEIL